jgi:ICP0-binding domain of Ubiquitin-specific protease 7
MKSSSSRGPDLKLYVEKMQDVWHPTVIPHRSPPPSIEEKEPTVPAIPRLSARRDSSGSSEREWQREWPEVGPRPGVYNSRHDAPMILIFLKWFDVDNQIIRGQRPIYVNRNDKTGKLTSVVAEMMGWDREENQTSIAFYEEIKPGMIEPLKPSTSFISSEIQDGDIICFMRSQSPKR